MNTQNNNSGNIVRSILLIAIGIILGIGIGIGISRIGNTPSSVSQKVGQFERQVVVRDLGLHALSFKVLVGHTTDVARLNATVLDNVTTEVLSVNSNDVRDASLLV